MKVIASHTTEFPKLGFSIQAGEVKELPADKEAASVIRAHWAISEVKDKKDLKANA